MASDTIVYNLTCLVLLIGLTYYPMRNVSRNKADFRLRFFRSDPSSLLTLAQFLSQRYIDLGFI